jgi:hypothetical protein
MTAQELLREQLVIKGSTSDDGQYVIPIDIFKRSIRKNLKKPCHKYRTTELNCISVYCGREGGREEEGLKLEIWWRGVCS